MRSTSVQRPPGLQNTSRGTGGVFYPEKLCDGRRWNYDAETLEKATEAVISGAMTPAAAARAFGVPQTTLYTRRSRIMTKRTEKTDGGSSS